MCATTPFIDLTYEHHKVEVKQISYEFHFWLFFQVSQIFENNSFIQLVRSERKRVSRHRFVYLVQFVNVTLKN